MSEQQIYVFNQYYIDFLKKVKGFAKEQKEQKKEARDILRSIKKHYGTMDKLSHEYMAFLETHQFWESYHSLEDPLQFSEEFQQKCLYQEIPISSLVAVLKDVYLLHHYLHLMDLFLLKELPVDPVLEAIKSLQNPTEFDAKLEAIPSEAAVAKLKSLQSMHKKHTRHVFDDELKGIESTSLGKLAREIMDDINIEELQKSMTDPNMDILGSLQNPNSGFGKVLSSVSQKMISKISSGELQQETLLQDAMNLATKLPGMMPGGMGEQLGSMGAMLQQFQKMAAGGSKKGGGMNPMDMLQSMMGGMNMNGAQRNAAGSRMSHAMRKQKASDRLKKKLQKHRENNMQREVERDHE